METIPPRRKARQNQDSHASGSSVNKKAKPDLLAKAKQVLSKAKTQMNKEQKEKDASNHQFQTADHRWKMLQIASENMNTPLLELMGLYTEKLGDEPNPPKCKDSFGRVLRQLNLFAVVFYIAKMSELKSKGHTATEIQANLVPQSVVNDMNLCRLFIYCGMTTSPKSVMIESRLQEYGEALYESYVRNETLTKQLLKKRKELDEAARKGLDAAAGKKPPRKTQQEREEEEEEEEQQRAVEEAADKDETQDEEGDDQEEYAHESDVDGEENDHEDEVGDYNDDDDDTSPMGSDPFVATLSAALDNTNTAPVAEAPSSPVAETPSTPVAETPSTPTPVVLPSTPVAPKLSKPASTTRTLAPTGKAATSTAASTNPKAGSKQKSSSTTTTTTSTQAKKQKAGGGMLSQLNNMKIPDLSEMKDEMRRDKMVDQHVFAQQLATALKSPNNDDDKQERMDRLALDKERLNLEREKFEFEKMKEERAMSLKEKELELQIANARLEAAKLDASLKQKQ